MHHFIDNHVALRNLRLPAELRHARSATFALAELSLDDNAAHSRELTRQLASCGCAAGGAAFLAYVAWGLIASARGVWPLQSPDALTLALLALGAPLVAGAGKLGGRAAALWRARRSIDRLLSRLTSG